MCFATWPSKPARHWCWLVELCVPAGSPDVKDPFSFLIYLGRQ